MTVPYITYRKIVFRIVSPSLLILQYSVTCLYPYNGVHYYTVDKQRHGSSAVVVCAAGVRSWCAACAGGGGTAPTPSDVRSLPSRDLKGRLSCFTCIKNNYFSVLIYNISHNDFFKCTGTGTVCRSAQRLFFFF
jgi:hypothetical protein